MIQRRGCWPKEEKALIVVVVCILQVGPRTDAAGLQFGQVRKGIVEPPRDVRCRLSGISKDVK